MVMRNFGRVAEVIAGGKTFSMKEFNLEASVPFDSDTLPNESEIKLWNLSEDSLNLFRKKKDNDPPIPLRLNAGYEGDVGLLFSGYISSVQTVWDGVDKVTTIHVLDSLQKDTRQEISFAKGTYGSAIIRQLAQQAKLPIAMLKLVRDYRYEDGYSASDTLVSMISQVAEDCQTRAYISKGKLYVRSLREGASNLIQLDKTKGMIGLPEYFEENGLKGYRLKQQLQYRVTTGTVMELSSFIFQGTLHVQGGTHRISRSGDFMTECEAVL